MAIELPVRGPRTSPGDGRKANHEIKQAQIQTGLIVIMAIFSYINHPSDLSRADSLSHSNIDIAEFSNVQELLSYSSSEIVGTGTFYFDYRNGRTFEAVLKGSFERTADGLISGPVESYEVKVNGKTFFSISQIEKDASDLWPDLLAPGGLFDLFLANDDKMLGGTKDDRLSAGSGDDLLRGFAGADSLGGSFGDDRLFGGRGKDGLLGGDGNDELDGGLGRDRLSGNEGNDTLIGGRGKDRLDGGQGDDVLTGGRGNDVFVFTNFPSREELSGHDVITDFHEGDVVRIKNFPQTSDSADSASVEQIGADVLISVTDGGTILVLDADRETVYEAIAF